MTQLQTVSGSVTSAPRSVGSVRLSTKCGNGCSRIDTLRTSGAMKLAFPRRQDAVEGILVNTAGGLTGGDRFTVSASAGPASRLVLSTQAAERAYKSLSDVARVETRLSVAEGAVLHWVPQELIVFDAASIERRLRVDLSAGAELVLVESVVFGRRAMNETLSSGSVRDSIEIRRDGSPIFYDRINMSGDIDATLERPAVAAGMSALATVIYCGPRAESLLSLARRILPATGGSSLLRPDLLCNRLLAKDSFLLRDRLLPVLEALTQSALPKTWRL